MLLLQAGWNWRIQEVLPEESTSLTQNQLLLSDTFSSPFFAHCSQFFERTYLHYALEQAEETLWQVFFFQTFGN